MPLFKLRHFSTFVASHIFRTMYASVLKFHTHIAYEYLAGPYLILDNSFIRFGTKLYRQTIGILMGINCRFVSF